MAIDRNTSAWHETEQWLQARREACVQSLINGTTSDDKLRGQVRVIDDLLTFASETKDPNIRDHP